MNDKRHIAIEPRKRNEYDRGNKVILVDGEKWGELIIEHHGVYGPSYHAHDLSGPVMVKRGYTSRHHGDMIEHSFRPVTKKAINHENLFKPDDKKVRFIPTDEQLRDHVATLIDIGALISPEARRAQIKERNDAYLSEREKAEQAEEKEFHQRAAGCLDDILACRELSGVDRITLITNITKAMRWAQTQ